MKLSALALALAVAAAGQSPVAPTGPPGVKVYSFDWRTGYGTEHPGGGAPKAPDYSWNDPILRERWNRERLRRGGHSVGDPDRLSMPSSSPGPARRSPRRFESSLQLGNAGAKAISAVEWEHVFYADRGKRSELRRFKLRREMKIEPGEQKFVSQSVPYEPRAKLPSQPRQGVEITRVEYADGTVWQRR